MLMQLTDQERQQPTQCVHTHSGKAVLEHSSHINFLQNSSYSLKFDCTTVLLQILCSFK
jgi:hypothetical protein